MFTDYAENAIGLPERLFPDIDTDSGEYRFYVMQNEIAIAVSEYRYYNGLTQTQLAKKLGVTQAMISKYESGDYNISLKAAFELFDKLGMRFSCTIDNPSKEDYRPVKESEQQTISTRNARFSHGPADDMTAA